MRSGSDVTSVLGIDQNITAQKTAEWRLRRRVGLYEDITERKAMEHQLRELSHRDALTGLANRAFFHHHLELALSKSRREGSLMALMYFDIDHFVPSTIRLATTRRRRPQGIRAARQRHGARKDVFERPGGDEFALLLDNLPNLAVAKRVAGKLVASMQVPHQLGERAITVSTRIGVAFFQRGMRAVELIRRAEQAMYNAKRAGRNRCEIAAAV